MIFSLVPHGKNVILTYGDRLSAVPSASGWLSHVINVAKNPQKARASFGEIFHKPQKVMAALQSSQLSPV